MARYPKNTTPKLTKELIEEISTIIKSGAYIETAVAVAGISKDTFYRWMRMAKLEGANDLLVELSYAVQLSLAECESKHMENINRAAFGTPEEYAYNDDGTPMLDDFGFQVVKKYLIKPNWKASAYRLSRRGPRDMSWQDVLDVTCEEDDNIIKVIFVDSKNE